MQFKYSMLPPDLITGRRVGCAIQVTSKKRLLETLGELLASASPTLSPETIFERLVERERLGSTGLGHGIALPHARAAEAKAPIGAFVQLKAGIEYDAIDAAPVDLAFALLVPEEANEMHLRLLSHLAEKFSDTAVRNRLRHAQSDVEILTILQS